MLLMLCGTILCGPILLIFSITYIITGESIIVDNKPHDYHAHDYHVSSTTHITWNCQCDSNGNCFKKTPDVKLECHLFYFKVPHWYGK